MEYPNAGRQWLNRFHVMVMLATIFQSILRLVVQCQGTRLMWSAGNMDLNMGTVVSNTMVFILKSASAFANLFTQREATHRGLGLE
jgi:hypothetical protein